MVVRHPADTLQRASVFYTHVCMCKACESSIRCSLKKHRHGEPFRFQWDEGNKSVAIHFVRHLMLKLASMHCVGIGKIVCSTSLQLCLCTQHYQLVYYMPTNQYQPITNQPILILRLVTLSIGGETPFALHKL